MSYRPGEILHSCQGKNTMEVVERNGIRSLFFGNSVVQSKVSLQDPHKLLLKYSQYMMAASLLIQPAPKRVLVVGVGAGSFLHFFNHFFPQTSIDGVDYSENLLQLARDYFLLPENDIITIHCDDGLNFLSKIPQEKMYDLILVDAFNNLGMAKNIYSNEFLRLANQHLSAKGIICCNLWSGDTDMFKHVQKAILKNSKTNLFIPVRKRENIIAMLLQEPLPWARICPSSVDLDSLSRKFGFDFKEVSASARRNNMKMAEKIQKLFR